MSSLIRAISRQSAVSTTSVIPTLRVPTSAIAGARLAQVNSQFSVSRSFKAFKSTMAAELPKTQKVVQIEKTGGVDVLQYTDAPVPSDLKDGEVLVKNEFIGVNYIDT